MLLASWAGTPCLPAASAGSERDPERADAGASLADVWLGLVADPLPEPRLTSHLPAGSAYYEGTTQASDITGTRYSGTFELRVRLEPGIVTGMVTNLGTSVGGRPWRSPAGMQVDRVVLPSARLRAEAEAETDLVWQLDGGEASGWIGSGTVGTFGLPTTFEGRLVSADADQPGRATGAWSVGTGASGSYRQLIIGGFEAAPGTDSQDAAGRFTAHLVNSAVSITSDANTVVQDGELRVTPMKSYSDAAPDPFALSLGTLFGDGYGARAAVEDGARPAADNGLDRIQPFTRPNDTHIVATAAGITQAVLELRETVAADVPGISPELKATLNTRRQQLFSTIVLQLQGELFGNPAEVFGRNEAGSPPALLGAGPNYARTLDPESGDPRLWSSGYPVDANGVAMDESVLEAVDEVVQALAGPDAFGAAFEEGGVFEGLNRGTVNSRDDDPANDLPYEFSPSALFGLPVSQIMVQVGRTDHTRFGAWRKRFHAYLFDPRNPHQAGYNNMNELASRGSGASGPDVFAYSPLAQARYASLGALAGTTATYTGKTVAVQNTNFYTGDVRATVAWHASGVGADLRVEISDLVTQLFRSQQFLRRGALDFAAGPRPGTLSVRTLTFEATVGPDLDFRRTVASGDPVMVTFEYDTPDGTGSPTVGEGETLEELPATVAGELSGAFVGGGAGGPAGLIGNWSVPYSEMAVIGVGNARDTIHGAFGADLAP